MLTVMLMGAQEVVAAVVVDSVEAVVVAIVVAAIVEGWQLLW